MIRRAGAMRRRLDQPPTWGNRREAHVQDFAMSNGHATSH